MAARRRKNLPGLVCTEHIFFAKDVAVFGEFLFSDARQHFVDDQIYVSLPAISVFRRNVVSTQEGGDVVQRGFVIQLPDRAEKLELVLDRQAITRFCFDGSSSDTQKPFGVTLAGLN